MSRSSLELRGGEGVLLGGSCTAGERARPGAVLVNVAGTLNAELGASRNGSLGETSVSSVCMVSSEDGEIPGPAGTASSPGDFLEGVVTNLMTDAAGS